MPLLEIRLAVFCLDGSELALEDRHEEISAAASRLEEARVDALSISFDQIEHLFDKPWRREYFAVIGDTLLGPDEIIARGTYGLLHSKLGFRWNRGAGDEQFHEESLYGQPIPKQEKSR